jgi:hypothetical protein
MGISATQSWTTPSSLGSPPNPTLSSFGSRARLKKTKQLKPTVHKRIGKAFDTEETESRSEQA